LTTDPATDTSPAWSPDGRWIAFVRLLPNQKGALILVPALPGPERHLGEIAVTHPQFIDVEGTAVAWSPDSSTLIVTDQPSPAEPSGLFAFSVATRERRRLTSLPPKAWIDTGPALSPDGRRLAFTRFVSFGLADLYVLPLTDDLRPAGEPKKLTYENRFSASPAWTPDGREIIFASGAFALRATDLFAVDSSVREGRKSKPRRLTSPGERAAHPAISRPSGGGRSRMIYAQSYADTNIWRLELPGRNSKANPAPPESVPFIFSTRPEYLPQFSLDGQRVAFVSQASGVGEIWICDKDGANLVPLTSAGWPETTTPRWSPDGSQIVFQARQEGAGDIFTIPAGGGAPKRLTDDPGDEWGPSWSRDGQWIYFVSARSGRSEIWKAPAGGGSAVQVTKNEVTGGAVESTDRRYVYYSKSGGLWRIPVEGGDESRVLESLSDWSRFALTEEGIYFVPRPSLKTPREFTIEFFSFSNEKIHTVARLEKPPFLGLTVSPNGRELLYSQHDQSGTDLVLVENFR
jgi:Tol biopolymer transport system component